MLSFRRPNVSVGRFVERNQHRRRNKQQAEITTAGWSNGIARAPDYVCVRNTTRIYAVESVISLRINNKACYCCCRGRPCSCLRCPKQQHSRRVEQWSAEAPTGGSRGAPQLVLLIRDQAARRKIDCLRRADCRPPIFLRCGPFGCPHCDSSVRQFASRT